MFAFLVYQNFKLKIIVTLNLLLFHSKLQKISCYGGLLSPIYTM